MAFARKLNPASILALRAWWNGPRRYGELKLKAQEFGVSHQTVRRVVTGIVYKEIGHGEKQDD